MQLRFFFFFFFCVKLFLLGLYPYWLFTKIRFGNALLSYMYYWNVALLLRFHRNNKALVTFRRLSHSWCSWPCAAFPFGGQAPGLPTGSQGISMVKSMCRKAGFDPWVGKVLGRDMYSLAFSTPVFLPEQSTWTEELDGWSKGCKGVSLQWWQPHNPCQASQPPRWEKSWNILFSVMKPTVAVSWVFCGYVTCELRNQDLERICWCLNGVIWETVWTVLKHSVGVVKDTRKRDVKWWLCKRWMWNVSVTVSFSWVQD